MAAAAALAIFVVGAAAAILRLEGPTSFALPGTGGQQGVVLADVTGDGRLDLLATTSAAGIDSVSIRPGDGAGGFGARTDWNLRNGPQKLLVFDLDGDGDKDIVAAATLINLAVLRFNDGTGGFAVETTFAIPANGLNMTAGDLDGDGDTDLVTSQLASSNVTVFLNNGSGIFAAGVNYSAGSTSRTTALGDADGDGDLDIIAVRGASTNIALLLNSGTGVFGAATIRGSGLDPLEILIRDLDRDGLPDVLTSNAAGSDLSFFRGLGGGTLAADSRLVSLSGPTGIAAEDLNGDGVPEVAAVHNAGAAVAVFANRSPAPPPGIAFANFQNDTTPVDTSGFVRIEPDTGSDSYVQIHLTGGGFYTDTLTAHANEIGTGANYGHSVNLFGAMGFDTRTGSASFGFWIADTYGAPWRQTSRAVVEQRSDSGLDVTVIGVTHDLAGGLGGFVLPPPAAFRGCLFDRTTLPDRILSVARAARDLFLRLSVGRLLIACYYALA